MEKVPVLLLPTSMPVLTFGTLLLTDGHGQLAPLLEQLLGQWSECECLVLVRC